MEKTVLQFILHHWWTWPLLLNWIGGWILVVCVYVSFWWNDQEVDHQAMKYTVIFGIAHYIFLISIIGIMLTWIGLRYVLRPNILRYERKKIEQKYRIKTTIAGPVPPYGKSRRILISCQCGKAYSLFGYAVCPHCKMPSPSFSREELDTLYSIMYADPIELAAAA